MPYNKNSPIDQLVEIFIYDYKENISLKEITDKWDDLLEMEPYSTLYSCLCDDSFEIKFREQNDQPN